MAVPGGLVAIVLAYTGFRVAFQAFKAGDYVEFGLYAVFCTVCLFFVFVILGKCQGVSDE